MIGTGNLQRLPIDDVDLDTSNPRIKKFLEMYQGTPTPDQILLALGAASDEEGDASTTFEKLKASILTNRGIIHPIITKRVGSRYLCIEGNTRLALYRHFRDRKLAGDWSLIPSLVYDVLDDAEANAIRLQLHLVGTRPWNPYSKAKYLHLLRTKDLLPFDQIVEYAGGRQKDVVEAINAYESMETHYRPLAGDEGFDTRMFSGFVELQKHGIQAAIVQAGFGEADFARWIYENKLHPLNTVRLLPRILRNSRAREIFLKQGAKPAVEILEKPGLNEALTSATIGELARALNVRAMALPWTEVDQIRKDPGSERALELREAYEALGQILELGPAES